MNGGKLIEPTFLPRTEAQAARASKQVIHPQVSADMRYLYRLNSTAPGGSGRRATVPGYRVGGKTGTAEKVINGRYSKDVRFNAFLASFPMDNPTYVVLTIIDEPKPEEGKFSATAGLNAAPMVAEIIRRSASFLGSVPISARKLCLLRWKTSAAGPIFNRKCRQQWFQTNTIDSHKAVSVSTCTQLNLDLVWP